MGWVSLSITYASSSRAKSLATLGAGIMLQAPQLQVITVESSKAKVTVSLSISPICRDVWRTIGIYVFAVPILIYTVIKKEYHNSDRTYGRKEREFM